LLAIVAVAIGVRVAYDLTTGHSGMISTLSANVAHNLVADGRWFYVNGRAESYLSLIDGQHHGIVDPASVNYSSVDRNGSWVPEVAESVGAPAVIAALWAMTGSERYIQIQLLQGFVDALCALLVYWIAMQLFKRRRGALLAAGLFAVYPPLAWQTANPYNDIWAVDFTIAIVASYMVATRSPHRWRALIACGVLVGVGINFRPEVIFVIPALAVAALADTGWREALRRALVPTLVASALLVPWTIRNFEEFHAFIPTRDAFWAAMYVGLAEVPGVFNEEHSIQVRLEAESERAHPGVVTETPSLDASFKHYFIQAVERHPLAYVEVLAHRVLMATVALHETIWMRRGAGPVFGYKGGPLAFAVDQPFELLEYVLQPAVFLLAMLGLLVTWRRWRRQNAALVAVVLAVLVPYLAAHVEARYLLPACFVYFIWIGVGADLLIEQVRSRWRSASPPVVDRLRPSTAAR
jgi:4-amino-4-deoxy-L-arabinose transferase-like glycosyltransferase